MNNERLCHWQRNENSLNVGAYWREYQFISERRKPEVWDSESLSPRLPSSQQLDGIPDVTSIPFSLDDRLLIGATPPRLRFETCRCQKDRIVAELQNSACLYPLSTRRGHHYIDSTTTGISGGKYVNLTANRTKKWEKLIRRKETILEEWENSSDLRGQAIIIPERLVEVVVSLCTFNATRVRLIEILKTDSM
jgi:hypothetical protein